MFEQLLMFLTIAIKSVKLACISSFIALVVGPFRQTYTSDEYVSVVHCWVRTFLLTEVFVDPVVMLANTGRVWGPLGIMFHHAFLYVMAMLLRHHSEHSAWIPPFIFGAFYRFLINIPFRFHERSLMKYSLIRHAAFAAHLVFPSVIHFLHHRESIATDVVFFVIFYTETIISTISIASLIYKYVIKPRYDTLLHISFKKRDGTYSMRIIG